MIITAVMILAAIQSHAQVTLGFQGGEPGDTWAYTSTGASAVAIAEAASSANKTTGTTSLVVGGNTGGGSCFDTGTGNGPDVARTFTFSSLDITTSSYFGRNLTFKWGNRYPVCNGTGWESGENLVFQAYLDGVAQAPTTVAVGNNNANFDIHTHTFSYSIPACVTSFYFTLSVTTNRADELLFIDDVKVIAPQLNPASVAVSPITGPTNVCAGSSATYSVDPISGMTFQWSGLPSGATFTTSNGTTTSNTIGVNWGTAIPGTYTLSVTSMDVCGNTSSPQTIQVEVMSSSSAPVITGPTAICPGETATLTSSIGTNITWSTGETTPTITINNPGVYSVVYSSTCGNATTSYTVGTSSGPQITSVTVTPVTCFGGNDGGLTVNTPETDVQFSINGGALQSSNTFNGLSAGNYSITVQSAGGCVSTTTATIAPGNALGVTITEGSSFCVGQTGTLNATVNTAGTYTYSWTGPNGYTSSVQNPNDITDPGTYTLVVNGNSCSASATEDVHFGSPPVVSFTATEVCQGNETDFSDASTVAQPDQIVNWNWDFQDGNNSNQQNPSHLYSSAGVYPVTLTATSSSGCSANATIDIQVKQNPDANFTFAPTLISVSDPTVQFTNSSQNANTYVWSFGEGTTSTETSPSFTYPQEEASYTVTLIALSANGCLDSIRKVVVIGEGLIYYVPNSFTPNNDGINDEFLPVLTSGFDAASYQLTIFDRWGEIVFETKELIQGWTGAYENELVQSGVYIWHIQFKHKDNDVIETAEGHVTLLR